MSIHPVLYPPPHRSPKIRPEKVADCEGVHLSVLIGVAVLIIAYAYCLNVFISIRFFFSDTIPLQDRGQEPKIFRESIHKHDTILVFLSHKLSFYRADGI